LKEYHEKIEAIKRYPNENYLQTSIENKKIILKFVDLSQDTIELIARWRNENKNWFLSRINATKKGTKQWIQNIIKNPDRLLFIIYHGVEMIGHIGVFHYDAKKNTAEIDSVLKAVSGSNPKLMENVLCTMFDWMFNDLKLSKVQLRVFTDNNKAINLYKRVGMSTIASIPLKKTVTSDGWVWNEIQLTDDDKFTERHLSVMEISKETFKKLKNKKLN